MAWLTHAADNLAWSGLLVGYASEILPYSIRAKGLTVMFLMVDIALFFNQYVNPIALLHIEWVSPTLAKVISDQWLISHAQRYYIVYCVWLLVEFVVVYFFYIETRYTPLEEIARHFDGEDALVGGDEATQKSRELAAEMGGLDTVDVGQKQEPNVEKKEL